MTAKAQILIVGFIQFARSTLQSLESSFQVFQVNPKSRSEFIEALRSRYSGVSHIYYGWQVVPAVGRFDSEILSACGPGLRSVHCNAAGYDYVDVSALTEKKIRVSNTPGCVDAATADLNLFLLLGAMRNLNQGLKVLRDGKFRQRFTGQLVQIGRDPRARTLGILGMGGIGQALRDRAAPLGFKKIVYYNRSRLSPEKEKGAEYVSFEELLAVSDVISITVPLNSETRHLINAETISQMKDDVVIVNLARGPVIDEQALVDGLKSGKVGSAGLDVFEFEPEVHPDLMSNDKVILTPHIGAWTDMTQEDMETTAMKNVVSMIETGKVLNEVVEQRGVEF